ncbi:MAG: hypothetical protein Q8O00_10275 [Holophaga sp.]|nr:hypothetical protein [Holophaga sp.]
MDSVIVGLFAKSTCGVLSEEAGSGVGDEAAAPAVPVLEELMLALVLGPSLEAEAEGKEGTPRSIFALSMLGTSAGVPWLGVDVDPKRAWGISTSDGVGARGTTVI